jgi:hypothetical protein
VTRWYVCDMDDGVLRVEATRRAAVTWWMDHNDCNAVFSRHIYATGYYSYKVGERGHRDSGSETAIVRGDKLRSYGIDTPPAEIVARYPWPDDPHDDTPPCPHGCGPLDWVDDQWYCPDCGDEFADDRVNGD